MLNTCYFYNVIGLATVISIKYVSLGKAYGKPSMKVKSYVSDEYKELVEFVSLH